MARSTRDTSSRSGSDTELESDSKFTVRKIKRTDSAKTPTPVDSGNSKCDIRRQSPARRQSPSKNSRETSPSPSRASSTTSQKETRDKKTVPLSASSGLARKSGVRKADTEKHKGTYASPLARPENVIKPGTVLPPDSDSGADIPKAKGTKKRQTGNTSVSRASDTQSRNSPSPRSSSAHRSRTFQKPTITQFNDSPDAGAIKAADYRSRARISDLNDGYIDPHAAAVGIELMREMIERGSVRSDRERHGRKAHRDESSASSVRSSSANSSASSGSRFTEDMAELTPTTSSTQSNSSSRTVNKAKGNGSSWARFGSPSPDRNKRRADAQKEADRQGTRKEAEGVVDAKLSRSSLKGWWS